MKQLATDFEAIFKRDRSLIVWMLLDFGLSVWLFLECLMHLDPGSPMYWRYSDINGGYQSDTWLFFLGFAVMAIVFGAGHVLISARLHTKRGKDVARLFLGISCALIVIALHGIFSLVGRA